LNKTLILDLPAVEVTQPIGTFYLTSMDSTVLGTIATADVRRLVSSTTSVEQYIGIQRKLDPKRRKDIADYVKTVDATFPTSIVIAVEDERCLEYDAKERRLYFFEVEEGEDGPAVRADALAHILDGQHRLAGLREADRAFGLPVTVFPAIDQADEAEIFATVNLAQTKVNSSLVYDLLAFSKSRSPERTCHGVAVALNSLAGSPFKERIKRLGSATPGVIGETLSQATFVRALVPYISKEPARDREFLRRALGTLPLVRDENTFRSTPFRNLFIEQRDEVIADIVWRYFDSVRRHWHDAWENEDKGQIIKRTNGFRAFMNVLGEIYYLLRGNDRRQPSVSEYDEIWACSTLKDDDFTRETYLPGSTGERNLTRSLQSSLNVFRQKRLASEK
jgi:DGQHR domain-containing protein